MLHRLKYIVLSVIALMWFICPAIAAATSPADSTDRSQSEPAATIEDSWMQASLNFIIGEPAESALYLGMWSYHFINDSEEYRTDHDLLGFSYKGYFLGTFMNSLDNRSWSGGLQRDVYRGRNGDFALRYGYRAGLVYGYDELSMFDSKLFPMIQLYADLSYKRVGVQLSWAGSAALIGFFLRF